MRHIEPSDNWKAILRKIRGRLPDPLAFYCPVCRERRLLDYRPRLRLKRLLGMFFLTAIIAGIFWPVMQELGFFVFIPIFFYSEGGEWMRVRESFRCPTCGFDPRKPLDPDHQAKLKRDKIRGRPL